MRPLSWFSGLACLFGLATALVLAAPSRGDDDRDASKTVKKAAVKGGTSSAEPTRQVGQRDDDDDDRDEKGSTKKGKGKDDAKAKAKKSA